MADAGHVAGAIAISDRKPVGEEQEIEPAALEHLGDVGIMRKLEEIRLVFRIAPDRMAVNHWPRNQETAKMHHSGFGHVVLLQWSS